MTSYLTAEIAQTAARLVVEDGLEYGPAKRQALKLLALPPRSTALPDNHQLEAAVAEYIALFCADTQPAELHTLRQVALVWMERMAAFQPYLGGAVWQGTATRLSDVYLQLFCGDSKSAEIALIDQKMSYEPRTVMGMHGQPIEALSLGQRVPELDTVVGIHLMIYDFDDLRGALRPDAQGRSPRGDTSAVRRLLERVL